jgi:hypothetical protein
MNKKITKITLKRELDTDPDLSWIGTFDNEAKSEFAIEHEPDNHRTFNWFNPQEGAVENKKQAKRDYDRMMAYENGHWNMIGIKAVAEVQTSENGREWLINHISSGGLWGIESDSDEEYKKEIEQEQLAELTDALLAFGFTAEEIKNAEIIKAE